jgi:transposase-like protein
MQILGIDATTAEDGAAGLTFLRSLTARRLPAVRLVTSDAHAGLLASISATLPGASCSGVAPITPPTRWR